MSRMKYYDEREDSGYDSRIYQDGKTSRRELKDSYYDSRGPDSRYDSYNDKGRSRRSYYEERGEDSLYDSRREQRRRSQSRGPREEIDRSRSRSRDPREERDRSRSRSPGPEEERDRSRSRSRGPAEERDRRRSRSQGPREERERSRSRSRGPEDEGKRSRGGRTPRGREDERKSSRLGQRSSNGYSGRGIPPPKDNLTHINRDSTLGGETFTPSSALFSSFAAETKKTPKSTTRQRVIPWDHRKKDYVYDAIHSQVLLGRMGRREVKRYLDVIKPDVPWSPDGTALIMLIVAAVVLVVGAIVGFVLGFFFFDDFKTYWWVWVLVGVGLIILAIILVTVGVLSDNSNIAARERAIGEQCKKMHRERMSGSGARIVPGPKAAYLSVMLDDRAFDKAERRQEESRSRARESEILGNPEVSIVKEKTVKDPDGRIIERRKVVDKRPEANSYAGTTSSIVKTSQKQKRFIDRLLDHKADQSGLYESRINAAPVQKNTEIMQVHYDSEVPEQRTYFDPNKSMNLMG